MTLSKLPSDPGFTELGVHGTIQSDDFPPDGTNPLTRLLGPNWTTSPLVLVLDFRQVSFMGSAGIGWLVQTHKALRAAGGRLICHSMKKQIEQALRFFPLQSASFIFAPDRTAALKQVATPLAPQPG